MKGVSCLLLIAILLPAAAAAQGVADRAGEVSALLPVGRIQRGSAPPAEARLSDAVFWRDWFETEARGRARLALVDGSLINVGSGARLQLVAHDAATQHTEVELQFGKIRNRVVGAPGRRFEVRTNTAVVGVIGTHFYVSPTAALTTVINFEGKVAVRNADAAVAGEETLEPFELAEIESGKPPRKRLATLEEIRQALEDTLPGPVMRLDPWEASAGCCVYATTDQALRRDAETVARTPFFEVRPQACSAPDITPVRICVPPTAPPGLHEYALELADGTQRWGGFLVRPQTALEGARLVFSPQLPAGATHYARAVQPDGKPLAGVPVRIRAGGQETTVQTDESGGFSFQAPAQGSIELMLGDESRASGSAPASPPRATIQVVERLSADASPPDFYEPGRILTLAGELRSVRLGSRDLPVARTRTADGRATSSVAIPPDAPTGPQPLELEDASGKRRQRSLQVYEVLAARLDQPALMSGGKTAGEFLVCVGSDRKPDKVRARIVAVGPVHFRGPGAHGKSFERTFPVDATGLVRIPFQIRGEKGAPGAGIPFTLTLRLTPD